TSASLNVLPAFTAVTSTVESGGPRSAATTSASVFPFMASPPTSSSVVPGVSPAFCAGPLSMPRTTCGWPSNTFNSTPTPAALVGVVGGQAPHDAPPLGARHRHQPIVGLGLEDVPRQQGPRRQERGLDRIHGARIGQLAIRTFIIRALQVAPPSVRKIRHARI